MTAVAGAKMAAAPEERPVVEAPAETSTVKTAAPRMSAAEMSPAAEMSSAMSATPTVSSATSCERSTWNDRDCQRGDERQNRCTAHVDTIHQANPFGTT
jgi:hypothetical protein